jgi:predicted nuclease with RNAse H fold
VPATFDLTQVLRVQSNHASCHILEGFASGFAASANRTTKRLSDGISLRAARHEMARFGRTWPSECRIRAQWNRLDMSSQSTAEIIVAGIDVSGRTTGRTALAWLRGRPGERPVLSDPPREKGLRGAKGDRNLVAALVEQGPVVVALDAPLALPHPVVCRDSGCPTCFPGAGDDPIYTMRQLERADRWLEISTMKGPMPMVMISGIAFRAIYLRRALERKGLAVIETWPMGVYRVLERRDGREGATALSIEARKELLALAVDGAGTVLGADASPDQVDAVAAALAAWSYESQAALSVSVAGSEDEGEIWLPTV